MKKYVIIILLLISMFLLTLNLGTNEEEVKEEKVVEKSISLPSTIQAYTYEGEKTDKTYEWLLTNKIVNKITCKNGTIAKFNYEDNSVSLSNIKLPDYCTIDFKEGYIVTLSAGSTGTVEPTTQITGYNGVVSFTVTPSDGYKAELSTNTCGGTLSGNIYTISNVKENKSCSIEFKKNGTVLSTLIKSYSSNNTNGVYNENGYRYEGSDPNNYIYMTNKSTNTKELWRIIGVFNDGENGEEVIRVRRHYEKNSYPIMAFSSGTSNYWNKTSMFNNLSTTYSISNYSKTVNFKFYSGAMSTSRVTARTAYTSERNSTTGSGAVGLIYISDYGYAVTSSNCNRSTTILGYSDTTACHTNNWLFQGTSTYQYLMSRTSRYSQGAYYIFEDGDLSMTEEVTSSWSYSPVMALSNSVTVNGTGTKNDPYTLIN